MEDPRTGSHHAAQTAFWNSPGTRAWADRHEPIDRLFSGITEAAIGVAAPRPGERVLDIGCGGGTTVFELAARVGPGGHVLGADVSEHSISVLGSRLDAAKIQNAEAMLADVASHAFEPGCFDLAFSRLGVMFFGDPVAAFRNVHRAMVPGGRLVLAVFRSAAENPFSVAPLAAVRHLLPSFEPPSPDSPGMFSWADSKRVHRVLQDAGYRDIALAPLDLDMRFAASGATSDAADLAMLVGYVSRALAAAPERRGAVRSALIDFFRGRDRPDGIALPGALWIVTARA